jgi:hypothetical protein
MGKLFPLQEADAWRVYKEAQPLPIDPFGSAQDAIAWIEDRVPSAAWVTRGWATLPNGTLTRDAIEDGERVTYRAEHQRLLGPIC